MTSYTAVQQANASNFSLTTEIALPWRFMSFGLVLFVTGDLVARQGASAAGTTILFAAYGALAAGLTLLLTRTER